MADQLLHDPLNRVLILRDYIWFTHIIKGHPELTTQRFNAAQAITNPQEIQFSASDPDCRVYYGKPSPRGRIFVVVANIATRDVKTAYITTKKKKSGAVEWSQ